MSTIADYPRIPAEGPFDQSILRRRDLSLINHPLDGGDHIVKELREHVATQIGPIAKPRQILVVSELPKTRSGKIMRRLLRDVAEHREVGDVTTLADPMVMGLIGAGLEKGSAKEEE